MERVFYNMEELMIGWKTKIKDTKYSGIIDIMNLLLDKLELIKNAEIFETVSDLDIIPFSEGMDEHVISIGLNKNNWDDRIFFGIYYEDNLEKYYICGTNVSTKGIITGGWESIKDYIFNMENSIMPSNDIEL
jgi:hypothetical protein